MPRFRFGMWFPAFEIVISTYFEVFAVVFD